MPQITLAEPLERLDKQVLDLAEAVSLAIRIEAQLLRRMRLDLFPTTDAAVEADLWFSHIVESRTSSGIVLHQDAAQVLRRRLGEKPSLLEAAWRVTESVHKNISPAILAEERLAYLSLTGKHQEVRDLLRSVVATLVSSRGRDLAPWAARAIGRLPDEARYSEETQMLAFGASLRLAVPGEVEKGLSLAKVSEWGEWLSPDDLQTVAYGVALLEDAVEFGPVGRPRAHRVELPKTTPVIVELSWREGGRERVERVALHPQNLTIVEIGPGVSQVDIRTVLGDSYWLTVPEPRGRKESIQKKLNRVRPPRVQITYEVETGSAIELKELPFLVGVFADLSGMTESPLPPLRERRFIEINSDNFDAVMEVLGPRLSFTVENRIQMDATQLRLDLKFQRIADFEPAHVVRQVGFLRDLLETRIRIAEFCSLLTANSTLQDEVTRILNSFVPQEASSSSFSSEPPYFEQVVKVLENTSGILRERAEQLARAVLENVAPTAGSKGLVAGASARVARIDEQLSLQLSAILHHPRFQRLESTWRGLLYLVLQTDTSELLKIRVWDVKKIELIRDFARASESKESATFKKAYEEEYGVFGSAPYGLFVGEYEFGPTPEDVELLENLSHVAASCHAPILATASPGMLGLDSFTSLREPRDLSKSAASPEFTRWNRFRNSDDSKYVGLTLPHVLLRLPYGKDSVPVDEFSFEEEIDGSHESFLWGNSAFAMAARVTNSFALYGWCASIRGVEGGGRVEGLPTYTFTSDDGDVELKCPTEIAITYRRDSELSQLGFIPLVHLKGTDSAAFFNVNNIQMPRQYDSPEATANVALSTQLPYIFAISRFAHYMKCMLRDKIGSFMTRRDLEKFLSTWISNYVLDKDGASQQEKAQRPLRSASIQVDTPDDNPSSPRVIAFLQPHFQLDELTVSLRLVVDLPIPAK